MQASGEAKYTGDMMLDGSELYAYIVKSQRALARIVSVDPSAALQASLPPSLSTCSVYAICPRLSCTQCHALSVVT